VGAVGDAGDGVVVADEVPDGVHQGGVLPGEDPVLVVVVGDAALEDPHPLGALRPEEAGRVGGALHPDGDAAARDVAAAPAEGDPGEPVAAFRRVVPDQGGDAAVVDNAVTGRRRRVGVG